MSDELAKISKHELVNIITKKGLPATIKPLIKEIHLFDTYVAGITYLEDKSVLDEIKVEDKLTLIREENNIFDNKAIMIMTNNDKKLGYIPEKDNIIFSRLMDAGKLIIAKIINIDKINNKYTKSTYTRVIISIYLVDF